MGILQYLVVGQAPFIQETSVIDGEGFDQYTVVDT